MESEQAREVAAELALHFEQGHDYRKAVRYLHQAGGNAVRRSANQEAVGLLTKGLELLKTLPDTPERTQQELTLQITLVMPLTDVKGYAAPEVGNAYARARELSQQIGETPQMFRVLVGLRSFYSLRGEAQVTREIGEQLLRLAQRVQDRAFLLEAHYALGVPLYHLGEFALARAHLEQGITLYDSQQHRSHVFLYGMDPKVGCLSYAAVVLWFLGYPDQALQRISEALTLAQELSHPRCLSLALYMAAKVHNHRREGQAAQERAGTAITLSTERGFPQMVALGTVMWGEALAGQGQAEEGIAQIHQGLADYRATGAEAALSGFLTHLAEAYGKIGKLEEGLSALAEALVTVDKTGERFYEAELHRLKGVLTLKQSGVRGPESEVAREAEECFQKAIEIARRQQAKSLELRAVIDLARLWRQQGKREEARRMLAEVYGWFTEGFDTADLKEAKTLLEELDR